jgi:hypothetical protein
MTLIPLAADVWEQALVNGRTVHPSDNAAALTWAKDWYAAQGGTFSGGEPAPIEAPVVEEPQPEPVAEVVEPEPVQEKPRRSRSRNHKPAEEATEQPEEEAAEG